MPSSLPVSRPHCGKHISLSSDPAGTAGSHYSKELPSSYGMYCWKDRKDVLIAQVKGSPFSIVERTEE